nr:DNA-directed DNA polymerase [Tanacetum cinerariifolium]
MAKMFLGKDFPPSMVTKLKNEITNFCQRPDESLFEAWERYKLLIYRCPNHNMLLVTQIDTFYNGFTLRHRDTINAAVGRTFIKRHPEECYDLIENMTAHYSDWDTSAQQNESSSSITSSSDTEITALKAKMAKINTNLMRVLQVNQQVKAVTPNCETCGGPHSFNDCLAIVGNTQNVYAAGAYQVHEDEYHFIFRFGNSPSRRETEATKDTVHPTNNGSTKDVQPSVVQTESLILNSDPVVAPIIEPVVAPVSALKPNQRPLIPFADALILMPKFGPTIKTLLTNKDKLSELARTPLNEHFSAVLLKKFLEKLGDPDKFLILCDFPRMAECSTLADLGTSINLMPLSLWNKLSLPDLSPTCMTLELANRLISRPVGVAEDVFVKVGTFHFPADFVIVAFDADARVPLILERSFLKTERAFIDVFEGELTFRVGKEAITFNLDQTSRYSSNYNDMTENELTSLIWLVRRLTSPSRIRILEGDDKFPVIIAKDLSVEEKTALITVLKSHKRAIAWKLFDIKGIDLEFCTHKILMEEDFKPVVQHQRRVNPKIHDVIKNEVLKLLDAGLIYPIFDSPWVSPVHCVPKKGGFTVVENEENELIPTRLVTGWRVCIDYRKLNEATRKDHFPLPFIDQMLERLAGNEYYCFLDGFSGYF